MRTVRVRRGLASVGAIVLLLAAACSSDDDDAASGDEPTTEQDAPADEGQDAEPADDLRAADAVGVATGEVTIDADVYAFESFRQCSIFPGGVVSISGTAMDDASTEVVLDVFEPGDHSLRVSGPGVEWTTTTRDFPIEVDGAKVSGNAEMVSSDGETALSTFTFNCE